jgi:TrmH family RNA methyltransferase
MAQIGEITSNSNGQVKNILALQKKSSARRKQGVFVAEGIKIFLEIPEKYIVSVYVSESTLAEIHNNTGFDTSINERVRQKLELVPYIKISDDIALHMSDTVTPQGIIVVARMLEYSIEDYINIEENGTFLILEEIKDPGNMGTIIRTAEGAGIKMVIMDSKCVDIYNPKVVRSTMGSIFRVPFIIEESLSETIDLLKKNGIKTYAAHLEGKEYYDEDMFAESSAIMIGNEAKGLSEEISQMADKLIRIPMDGELESLNASVAAAILMYEARKKRNK